MKKVFLLAISIIALNICNAQTNYYKSSKGVIVDSVQYVKLKSDYQKIFKKVHLIENIEEAYRKEDSIVNNYRWELFSGNLEKHQAEEKIKNQWIGKEFPFDNFSDLLGSELIASMKSKPTMIDFWFTSCAPCVAEIPALNGLKKKYDGKVNFVAITFNKKNKVASFLAKRKYDFIQITDAKKPIKSLYFMGYPTNMFLDKGGVIRKIEGGLKSGKLSDTSPFEKIIDELIEE